MNRNMEKLIFDDIDPDLYQVFEPVMQDIFNQTKRWRLANGRVINAGEKYERFCF